MRLRLLLPVLFAAALLPLPAAHADEIGGTECSSAVLIVQPSPGDPWTFVVDASWVVTDTNVSSWSMSCQLWRGDASFDAGDPPARTFSKSMSGPAFAFAQQTTIDNPEPAGLVWCMSLTWRDSLGNQIGNHSRCYLQPNG